MGENRNFGGRRSSRNSESITSVFNMEGEPKRSVTVWGKEYRLV